MTESTNSIGIVVGKIRGLAAKMKTGKKLAAETVIKGLKLARKPLDGMFIYQRAVTETIRAVNVCLQTAISNSQTVEAVKTLVANTVQDAANRVNEAANLVEMVGKDPLVIEAVDSAVKAQDAYTKWVADERKRRRAEFKKQWDERKQKRATRKNGKNGKQAPATPAPETSNAN